MSPQDVARGIQDDLAVINFNAFGMRRVMSHDYIGARIDQVVRKFAVLRADIVLPIRGPMDRHHDVINLGPQPANVLLNQEWIHGNDPGTALRRECGLAHVIELRIAQEAEPDSIPRQDDGLASFGQIVSASDMSNAGGGKSAQRIQKSSLFRVKGMVISEVYEADSRGPHGFCELLRRAVQAILAAVIGQSALAIDDDQVRRMERGSQPLQWVA